MFYKNLSMKGRLNNHKMKIAGSHKGSVTVSFFLALTERRVVPFVSWKSTRIPSLFFYYLLPRGGDYIFPPLWWHFQNNSCSVITSSGRRKNTIYNIPMIIRWQACPSDLTRALFLSQNLELDLQQQRYRLCIYVVSKWDQRCLIELTQREALWRIVQP